MIPSSSFMPDFRFCRRPDYPQRSDIRQHFSVFCSSEDSGPRRERLSESDIVCQKKAWIAVFVGVENLLNSHKLVRFECYRFVCWKNWERSAVQLALDLLFPTDCFGSNPSSSSGNACPDRFSKK